MFKTFRYAILMAGVGLSARAEAGLDRVLQGAPPLPAGYATPDAMREAGKAGKHERLGPQHFPSAEGLVVERDVEYANVDAISLTLDVYRSQDLDGPAPGLIFVHGGGWRKHWKEFYTCWCLHYAHLGYVCATVEYRISSEAPFPAAVADCRCAVRWFRAHARDYGLDAERIAVVGQSAGAHLALMVAYAPEDAFPSPCADKGVSAELKAVVAYYPPTDLAAEGFRDIVQIRGFLVEPYDEVPERYVAASPITYVSPEDPPTLLFHGTIDSLVPVDQSDRLAKRLEEAKVPYVYDRQKGWDHGMDLFKEVNRRCLYIQDRFLAQLLDVDSGGAP